MSKLATPDKIQTLDHISNLLNVFSSKIKMLAAVNEGSIHIHAEDIYANILNNVFGYNLKNANTIQKNFPAVDLVDEKQRIAFQITATTTNKKLEHTLLQFIEKKLYLSYDKLYILITTEKGRNSMSRPMKQMLNIIPTNCVFRFDIEESVLDWKDIYKKIKENNDRDAYIRIAKILTRELGEIDRLLKPRFTIFLSFSSDNFSLVRLVVNGLLHNGYLIVHDSPELQREFQDSYDTIQTYDESLHNFIHYCIVFISPVFLRVKWNVSRRCPILQRAINFKAKLFSYYTDAQIPTSIRSISFGKPEEASVSDYQKIVDTVTNRLKVIDFTDDVSGVRNYEEILEMASPDSTYKEIEENNTIGFVLYERTGKFSPEKIYFIFVEPSAAQQNVFDYFKENHPEVLQRSLWIILISNTRKKNSEIRLEKFKSLFNPYQVVFLEDFIWNHCTDKAFRELPQKFNVPNYIPPNLHDETGTTVDYEFLENWVTEPNQPILVLKGSGGIGKTTMAMRIADCFIDHKPNSRVLFIDSRQIIRTLRNRWEITRRIDLYAFYEALTQPDEDHPDFFRLDARKFKHNMDHGNILMIIDGLDEVMANIPKFDVSQFFQSISDYNPNFCNGKVLISCRNYFWNKSIDRIQNDINVVEILPFDEYLTASYFEMRHQNSPKRRERGIKMAKSLSRKDDDQETEVLPFVLEIIDNWLESKIYDDQFDDISFESTHLTQKNTSDYIIYMICNREMIRINGMEVDQQIKVFIELSIQNLTQAPGLVKLSISQFEKLLLDIFPDANELEIESFKGHALIASSSDLVEFKFDFLADYFKNVYVTQFLDPEKNQTVVTAEFIIVLANHLNTYSSYKDIYNRVKHPLDEEMYLHLLQLIENIRNYSENKIRPIIKTKAISNLFYITILMRNKLNRPEIASNTEVMRALFGKDEKTISQMAIVDLFCFDDNNIIFNFEGLKFENCYISNYPHFWDCKFDKNTIFNHCELRNLNSEYIKKNLDVRRRQFNGSHLDFSVDAILDTIEKKDKHESKFLTEDVFNFLHLFLKQGRLNPGRITDISTRYKGRVLTFKEIVNFLYEQGVIDYTNDVGDSKKIFIREPFQLEVSKYLTQGIKSYHLNKVLSNLIIKS